MVAPCVTNNCQNIENTDPSSPSPAPVSMPANEGITKEHTRFLISLMREHIESEGDSLPITLKDLNARLKHAKSTKKQLWIELAEKLSGQFNESFCPDKVARKWQTLTDAYMKVKDNNRSAWQGAMRFQFFADMDALLGGHHDVSFPVVGTAARLQICHPGPLYQKTGDGTILYKDEACTIMVSRVDEADNCLKQENTDPSAPSPASMSMSANECITKEHTHFLISLMREHIECEGDGLPRTLKDLNARLKRATKKLKSTKKQLWIELAEKLSRQFNESFCPDKVARKWQTLTDAYKKVKDNNGSTGRRAMRFQFFADMDALLGGHHDESFPVVGTAARQQICHLEALTHCSSVPPFTQSTTAPPPTGSTPDTPTRPTSTPDTPTTPTPATPRSRKRSRADGEFDEAYHDVSFPVVGTAAGLQIRHPEALTHCSSVSPFTQSTTAPPPTGSTPDTPTTSTPATPRSCKRRGASGEVLQYLRESDEAYRRQCDAERADRQAALERILGAMQSVQQDFCSLMRSFLEKQ